MAERWRCSPSTRGAGPVENDWKGLGASRCRGEHDALARQCRKARWRAGHTRGDGVLAGGESEGEWVLTVCYQVLRGVARNGKARAKLEEGNRRMAHALRRNGRSGARSCNGDGGALCARSGGERARVDEREWQRRGRRARPGAPGGRPGRVHPGACAPRGDRALPACHGGTARPAVARGRGRWCGEGKGALLGWAGFGQRARSEAAAC